MGLWAWIPKAEKKKPSSLHSTFSVLTSRQPFVKEIWENTWGIMSVGEFNLQEQVILALGPAENGGDA